MKVHMFGNAPYPAVATYALRQCVNDSECPANDEVREISMWMTDFHLTLPSRRLLTLYRRLKMYFYRVGS